MDLFTILSTFCFISILRHATVQSADIVNPGRDSSLTCSGDCNIICNSTDGCRDSIFYITNTAQIAVYCIGRYACYDTIFYYAGSADVDHLCYGNGACSYMTMYAFNPMHLTCQAHNDGGYDSCRTTGVIDLVPPLSGQLTITVDGSDAHQMAVFSFYHQGQIYNCLNSCHMSSFVVYFGPKFNEYCYLDDAACLTAQSTISDTKYGEVTIMDTLSGDYGTTYDFSAYDMTTNVLLVLLDFNNEHTAFYPPVMSGDSSTFVSVICVKCGSVDLHFASINHAILTGAALYSTSRGSVEGPSASFMVNSYFVFSIYRTTIQLGSYDNVDVRINTLADATVYLGNNLNVRVNCGGPGENCDNVDIYSDVDPSQSDLSNFFIDCDDKCTSDKNFDIYFPNATPSPLTCAVQNSGVSAGCEFFPSSLHPTPSPSTNPSLFPTITPTQATLTPTKYPTINPTNAPSLAPTRNPTKAPSSAPTSATNSPSSAPTRKPTQAPSTSPSQPPTHAPSNTPTQPPTYTPTLTPSQMHQHNRQVIRLPLHQLSSIQGTIANTNLCAYHYTKSNSIQCTNTTANLYAYPYTKSSSIQGTIATSYACSFQYTNTTTYATYLYAYPYTKSSSIQCTNTTAKLYAYPYTNSSSIQGTIAYTKIIISIMYTPILTPSQTPSNEKTPTYAPTITPSRHQKKARKWTMMSLQLVDNIYLLSSLQQLFVLHVLL
eukprot:114336_1